MTFPPRFRNTLLGTNIIPKSTQTKNNIPGGEVTKEASVSISFNIEFCTVGANVSSRVSCLDIGKQNDDLVCVTFMYRNGNQLWYGHIYMYICIYIYISWESLYIIWTSYIRVPCVDGKSTAMISLCVMGQLWPVCVNKNYYYCVLAPREIKKINIEDWYKIQKFS